jgi:quercetin dioxygenase-like cupin family protein
MKTYHHLGIPTTKPRPGEEYLEQFKIYVSGYESSPYGVEWMRYEAEATLPELVKSVPHLAFEVDDLEKELQGKKVIIPPNSPSEGVMVAFIEDNGAPIEFLQFTQKSGSSIPYQVEFEKMGWQEITAGVREKAVIYTGQKLRLVEYDQRLQPHWCEKGHMGMILDGELDIRFAQSSIRYKAGDGVFIPPGPRHKHQAVIHTEIVRALFVEVIEATRQDDI